MGLPTEQCAASGTMHTRGSHLVAADFLHAAASLNCAPDIESTEASAMLTTCHLCLCDSAQLLVSAVAARGPASKRPATQKGALDCTCHPLFSWHPRLLGCWQHIFFSCQLVQGATITRHGCCSCKEQFAGIVMHCTTQNCIHPAHALKALANCCRLTIKRS